MSDNHTLTWHCPQCSRSAPMKPSEFPVNCACGAIEDYQSAVQRLATGAEKARRIAYLSCPHRGHVLAKIDARTAGCGCPSTSVEAFHCQRFDEPVLKISALRCRDAIQQQVAGYTGRSCRDCAVPRRSAYVPNNGSQLPGRLNLIYHVCPLRNNAIWEDNLQQILARWSVFNNRKILAIATGDGLHCPETVQLKLNRSDVEYLLVPNDRELREVESFPALLGAIQSTNSDEATFYAHSKGNSTGDNVSGAWLWALAMYRHLLDQPQVVREALRTFAAVGTCKMVWPAGHHGPYPTQQPSVASQYVHLPGNWTFAGTFFWFRHDAIFTRDWSVRKDRYAAEAWLAGILDEHRGLSVYQPWPVDVYPTPCPYLPHLHLGQTL